MGFHGQLVEKNHEIILRFVAIVGKRIRPTIHRRMETIQDNEPSSRFTHIFHASIS